MDILLLTLQEAVYQAWMGKQVSLRLSCPSAALHPLLIQAVNGYYGATITERMVSFPEQEGWCTVKGQDDA